VFCALICASFLVAAAPAFAGFGITPPYVRNDRLTQGSTFTQEIVLVRGDPKEDLKAEVTVNVPGIDAWITVDRGDEFLLPAGEKQVPMLVTVQVPNNAEYARHQGSIRIRTMSPDPASGVSIALGAQIDVDLRIVDEIRDFEVRRVRMSEAEEPRRVAWFEFPGKIAFTMGIENTGNAPTTPNRVQLEILDKRGNVVLETVTNTNQLDEVLPFETRDVVANIPTRLPPGAYLVKYSIYRFEDEAKRSGELTLSILPEGTLDGYTGYGIEGLSMSDKLSIIIPLGVLALALLLGAVIVTLRAKNARSRGRRPSPPQGPPQAGQPTPCSYGSYAREPRVQQRSQAAPQRERPLPPPPRMRVPQQPGGVVDLTGRRRRG